MHLPHISRWRYGLFEATMVFANFSCNLCLPQACFPLLWPRPYHMACQWRVVWTLVASHAQVHPLFHVSQLCQPSFLVRKFHSSTYQYWRPNCSYGDPANTLAQTARLHDQASTLPMVQLWCCHWYMGRQAGAPHSLSGNRGLGASHHSRRGGCHHPWQGNPTCTKARATGTTQHYDKWARVGEPSGGDYLRPSDDSIKASRGSRPRQHDTRLLPTSLACSSFPDSPIRVIPLYQIL